MTDLVRASGIRGYREVMRSLGADPEHWLGRYHIAPQALDNDDALLPTEVLDQLLEASSRETGCADLGLRIAQNQSISVLGPLGVVIQNSPTVLDALHMASRYLFIHSAELGLNIFERSPLIEDAFELTIEIRRATRPAGRQTIDLCLGAMHRMAQLLMGPLYKVKAVTVTHAPVAPLIAYRRFFGAPVFTSQARASLHIDSVALRAAMPDVNPALRQITEDYLLRNFQIPGNSVSARVRLALRRMLGTPMANKDGIAAMLAMHPRTLHRRLDAEGTSFDSIREEIRKELTLQYLRDTHVSLSQLSGLLGFAQQAAFTRSCRRWFGETPSELRKSRVENLLDTKR